MCGAHSGAGLTQSHRWKGRWRREEALTSALKARGLWYLVSPVAPLHLAWPPPWLWLWGSTPRSCPRRHSSSSLWPDCEWCGAGKGKGGKEGWGGMWTVGVRGWGWVTGVGYRGAVAVVFGGRCVRWIEYNTDRRQQTWWGDEERKRVGENKKKNRNG